MSPLSFLCVEAAWWRDPVTLGAVFTGVIAIETLFYVLFTIGLWKATRKAADAAAVSAEAARISANAAKQSSDVAASLHRPFMGLPRIRLQTDRNSRTWVIGWTIRNSGTLPALAVDAALELRAGPKQWPGRGPNAVEVFPQGEFESLVRVVFAEDVHTSIITGNQILEVRARIEYRAKAGDRYMYTADAQYNHETDAFMILASKTEDV